MDTNEVDSPNTDVPEFTKNIRSVTVPMDVNFSPTNHFTAQVPIQSNGEYKDPNFFEPVKEEVGSVDTAIAQFKHVNDTWHYLHAGYTQTQKPWFEPSDPNFNPLSFEDKFTNVRPEYYQYLLDADNEQDMNFRLNRIYTEQQNHDNIENGTWLGYLTGGGAGLVTDLTNYIPIVGWMKYAKYSQTFLKSAVRALPGAAAYGVASSVGEAVDSINGNFQDTVIDAMTKTAFAASMFGGFATVGLTMDKMALWEARGWMNDYIKGVGVKLKVDKEDKIIGYQAYDMTDGALSADKVKLAQDKLDSTFSKTGIFKVPYVGEAATKFLGNRYFGSTIISMLNSPYPTLRTIGDLAADHGIITEGVEAGKPNPKKFFTLMKQTHATIRAQEAQLNAMHLERNGFDLSNYVAQGAVKAGLYTRDKVSELLSKDLGNREYISRAQFLGEIENVLYTKTPHANGAVNEAAGMFRKAMDKSYADWRKAYNLPEDWMPPRTAEGYLMRVYDTAYLNQNENQWTQVISDYLRDADEAIILRSEPINTLESQIKDFEVMHTDAVRELAASEALEQNFNPGTDIVPVRNEVGPGIKTYTSEKVQKALGNEQKLIASTSEIGGSKETMTLREMKARLKAMKEDLQNELRSNPEFQLHVDDWNALSANEAAELKGILKPIENLKKSVQEQSEKISQLKAEKSKQLSAAKLSKTAEKAKPKAKEFVQSEDQLIVEEKKLNELKYQLSEAEIDLNMRARKGQINRRFFTDKKNVIEFKNPNDRLKFRDTYHQQKGFRVEEDEAHALREEHAQAYYNTIMNQTAEDTINQIMGKYTGNSAENHIMNRTLMIPDEILYKAGFMTKDLMAKVANYQSWLARRTHLKNVYNDVTIDGGFEALVEKLDEEFQSARSVLNDAKAKIEKELESETLSTKERKQLTKKKDKVDKELAKEFKRQEKAKYTANFAYEKMAGISRLSSKARSWSSAIRSGTVAMNLGFLPASMITDLSANGLQHGVMGLLRDGIYPMIVSLGGILKTATGETYRKSAAAANLGFQHIGSANAEKNIGMQTNPYLNMGKIPGALNSLAHFASNMSFANLIDNHLQRTTASVIQAAIMRVMHDFKAGKASKSDIVWANKYGLDPNVWADRMINAYKQNGGGKTLVGGYQSNYWLWQDLGASNAFSDAIFRGVYDTVLNANVLDTPIWMDSNGPIAIMGPIIKGFHGWAFGSLNRYLIPSMQKPDAQKLMGVLGMLAAGAMVSPTRRMSRGEDPYPKDMTMEHWAYEVMSDSGYMSYFTSILNDANLISGGTLLRDLKNDKYRDRSRAGLLGPAFGDVNSMLDFFSALSSNEMNEYDALKMARMTPPMNSIWTYGMSSAVIKAFGWPKTREIAHRQKGH